MLQFQKVIVAGNLFSAPSIKRFNDTNSAIVEMRIGVTESWKDRNGEWQNRTESFIAVRRNASFAFADYIEKNFHKGTNVMVEGANRTRSWRPEGSDKDVYVTELMIDKIEKIADSMRQNAQNGTDVQRQPAQNHYDSRQRAQNGFDRSQRSAPAQSAPQQASVQNPSFDNADAFDDLEF